MYCPYLHNKSARIKATGLVVQIGDCFTIIPRKTMKEHGITVHKSGAEVIINGTVKPVWIKDTWDMCQAIDDIAEIVGLFPLADFLVTDVYITDGGYATCRF